MACPSRNLVYYRGTPLHLLSAATWLRCGFIDSVSESIETDLRASFHSPSAPNRVTRATRASHSVAELCGTSFSGYSCPALYCLTTISHLFYGCKYPSIGVWLIRIVMDLSHCKHQKTPPRAAKKVEVTYRVSYYYSYTQLVPLPFLPVLFRSVLLTPHAGTSLRKGTPQTFSRYRFLVGLRKARYGWYWIPG